MPAPKNSCTTTAPGCPSQEVKRHAATLLLVPRLMRSPASSAARILTPKATAHCRHRVGSAAAAGGRLYGGVLCRLRLLERAAPDSLQGVSNHTFDLVHPSVKR